MTVAGSQYFSTDQLAKRYGMHPDSIRRWRYKGIGPEYYEVSIYAVSYGDPRVRYDLYKVLAWEEANGITPIEPFLLLWQTPHLTQNSESLTITAIETMHQKET